MRDDLKNYIEKLNHLYQNKIVLLDKIFLSETEKKYALKSKNSNVLLKNLEENDESIDAINSIDYEITKTRENICSTLGIQPDQMNEFIINSNEPAFFQLIEAQDKIKNIIKGLICEREKIIEEIEKESISIKEDMDSLYRIFKLKSK